MATITAGYDAAGNAKDYTTITAAINAASASDTVEVWYANAYKRQIWNESVSVGKAITLKGALNNQGVRMFYVVAGPMLTVTESATIENLEIFCYNTNSYCILLNGSGKTGTVRRCRMSSDYNIIQGYAGTWTMEACIFRCQSTPFYLGAGTYHFHNCGLFGAAGGYGYSEDGATVDTYNCWVIDGQHGYCWKNTVTGDYNASFDSSAAGTHDVNMATGDCKFWKDASTSFLGDDYRIRTGSVLAGAGTNKSVTYDLAGRAFAIPPSIGPYEVWDIPTAPAATDIVKDVTCVLTDGSTRTGTFDEAARNVGVASSKILTGYSIKILNVTTNGSAVEESHTADEVLKSAGGNYNDDNLTEVNIKSGVVFGLSGTGGYTAGATVSEFFNGTVGDGTLTLAQSMRILLAGMAGKTSGQPGTPAFTSINGTSTVIQATVDTNGNRTAVTVTP